MVEDLLDLTLPRADRRIHYGAVGFSLGISGCLGCGEAASCGLFTWWLVAAEFNLAYGGHLCAGLRAEGLAV